MLLFFRKKDSTGDYNVKQIQTTGQIYNICISFVVPRFKFDIYHILNYMIHIHYITHTHTHIKAEVKLFKRAKGIYLSCILL